MPFLSKKKCLVCATSIFLGLFAFNVNASEDGGDSPMLPEEVIALEAESYAQTYGVSLEEAVRRLSLMHNSDVMTIVEQAGDDLGGIYFDVC